ncbi:MAG: hypothetical protein CSA09_03205 [Candidatus Contendobacter odensis]|uniref:FAD-binding FR-type domain-containing protein n=1 Tax=Candidatus Contendibacter odensensis TaxID=1400860 RepID=A0A2G6PF19_9GAMM|nr:MAG: hypothetical protein CSA09_03205 [Candidatus Contendobacter odensis]
MGTSTSATGRVLGIQHYPGGYTLLRLTTDRAASFQPGHALQINGALWPILQTTPEQNGVDCLQRSISPPPSESELHIGDPGGIAFDISAATPRALLLADNDGIAAITFLARALHNREPRVKPLALFGLTHPLPFQPQPSRIMTAGLPSDVIAALPLLEDWGIPSRIACPTREQPGCFEGQVVDLAQIWLNILQGVADITVFACGSDQLLKASCQLSDDHQLACQSRRALLP